MFQQFFGILFLIHTITSSSIYDSCISCGHGYQYCPSTSSCTNQTQCPCFWQKTQCPCLLKTTQTNCSSYSCTWLPCTGTCVPTDSKHGTPLCISDARCIPPFPSLELGLVLGLGLGSIFVISCIVLKRRYRVGAADKTEKRRNIIVHLLCNVCSVLACGAMIYYILSDITEFSVYSPLVLYSTVVAMPIELTFIVFSWVCGISVPNCFGKLKHESDLDRFSELFVLWSYYAYYLVYLFSLALFLNAYFNSTLTCRAEFMFKGCVFVRLLPFVAYIFLKIYECAKKCGVSVGGATNPLLTN